jgi:hypothetical protein
LVLEYQMVKEYQFWFSQFADVNAIVAMSTAWAASYNGANTPSTWTTQQTKTYAVSLTNNGSQTWPSSGPNPVHLGVHFANVGGGFGTNAWYTDQRFNLPADLAPGASLTMNISVTAPTTTTGVLVLEYQMVKEYEFWFGQFSDLSVTVQ